MTGRSLLRFKISGIHLKGVCLIEIGSSIAAKIPERLFLFSQRGLSIRLLHSISREN
jgi:hypothetical protein